VIFAEARYDFFFSLFETPPKKFEKIIIKQQILDAAADKLIANSQTHPVYVSHVSKVKPHTSHTGVHRISERN
tara:strand:- start:2873 stop:3091 length:219 start_codon:yes stop_codon:yes gene_type:complete